MFDVTMNQRNIRKSWNIFEFYVRLARDYSRQFSSYYSVLVIYRKFRYCTIFSIIRMKVTISYFFDGEEVEFDAKSIKLGL